MADSPPDKVTPMLRQYLDLKSRYPDALLLFQMGDFYETFFEDAAKAAAALNIALTSRSRAEAERIPMAGFPIHAAPSYFAKLLDAGFKVVVCDQTEDPAQAKGLVRREVTRVLTRGTLVDPAALDARQDNYLAAVNFKGAGWGLAYLSVSTGEFRLTQGEGADALADELWRLKPAELIVPEESDPALLAAALAPFDIPPTRRFVSRYAFDPEAARRELGRALGTLFLDGFGVEDHALGVAAAGAILRYLHDSHTPELPHLDRLLPYTRDDYLGLDEATLRHLEIFETWRSRSRQGSLLDALDCTVTPMGARSLGRWLRYPLKDLAAIESRLDGVEFFLTQSLLRPRWRQTLKGLGDLERLTARVALEQATPREVAAIKLRPGTGPPAPGIIARRTAPLVAGAAADLDPLPHLQELIGRALVDDPPLSLKDGGIIREGYDAELDELISAFPGGQGLDRPPGGPGAQRHGHQFPQGALQQGLRLLPGGLQGQPAPGAGPLHPQADPGERRALHHRGPQGLRVPGPGGGRNSHQAGGGALRGLAKTPGAGDPAPQAGGPGLGDSGRGERPGGTGCRAPLLPPAADRRSRCWKSSRAATRSSSGCCPPAPSCPTTSPWTPAPRCSSSPAPTCRANPPSCARWPSLSCWPIWAASCRPRAAVIGLTDRIFTRVGAVDDIGRGQSTFLVEMTRPPASCTRPPP